MKTKKRGQPPGPTGKPLAKRFNTTFKPDMLAWLVKMKARGHSKAKVIDMALRKLKAEWDG